MRAIIERFCLLRWNVCAFFRIDSIERRVKSDVEGRYVSIFEARGYPSHIAKKEAADRLNPLKYAGIKVAWCVILILTIVYAVVQAVDYKVCANPVLLFVTLSLLLFAFVLIRLSSSTLLMDLAASGPFDIPGFEDYEKGVYKARRKLIYAFLNLVANAAIFLFIDKVTDGLVQGSPPEWWQNFWFDMAIFAIVSFTMFAIKSLGQLASFPSYCDILDLVDAPKWISRKDSCAVLRQSCRLAGPKAYLRVILQCQVRGGLTVDVKWAMKDGEGQTVATAQYLFCDLEDGEYRVVQAEIVPERIDCAPADDGGRKRYYKGLVNSIKQAEVVKMYEYHRKAKIVERHVSLGG